MPESQCLKHQDELGAAYHSLRSADQMLAGLDFVLLPIADSGTGVVYGYEAQITPTNTAFSASPSLLLDHAHVHGFLPEIETKLFQKALERFREIRAAANTKLFYKLDGRDLGLSQDARLSLGNIRSSFGFQKNQVCLGVSEHRQQLFTDLSHHAIALLRQNGFMVALDDFGQMSSELRLLHDLSPDYVKIDRFFLNGIDIDSRKKLLVTTIANLTHILGARVIAEGVETNAEYRACLKAGCDLVQGPFVGSAPKNKSTVKLFYDHIRPLPPAQNRQGNHTRIANELLNLPTVHFGSPVNELLDLFVKHHDASIIPVLDSNHEPRGIVHEQDLKAYLYAGGPDAEDAKAALDFPLRSLIRPCPVADIDTHSDMLLATFASSANSDGIIITQNFRYAGFLYATSLLKIIHEKRLQEAQDQNPLTGLPGNVAISRYIGKAARKAAINRHLCYLDFDNFKPFNDTYGYPQGDRAIILFGELLQKHLSGSGAFHGHVGGDDFFAGFQAADQADVAARMQELKQAFSLNVKEFYDQTHREQGFIEAPDRFGTIRQFPLLQCSISILSLPKGTALHPDKLNEEMMEMKRLSKCSEDGFAIKTLAA